MNGALDEVRKGSVVLKMARRSVGGACPLECVHAEVGRKSTGSLRFDLGRRSAGRCVRRSRLLLSRRGRGIEVSNLLPRRARDGDCRFLRSGCRRLLPRRWVAVAPLQSAEVRAAGSGLKAADSADRCVTHAVSSSVTAAQGFARWRDRGGCRTTWALSGLAHQARKREARVPGWLGRWLHCAGRSP
jgi:hypothetical protein